MVVNPTLLFTRLAIIARGEDGVKEYFDFELTHQALALLKDKLMRNPEKASLRNVFLTAVSLYESSKTHAC